MGSLEDLSSKADLVEGMILTCQNADYADQERFALENTQHGETGSNNIDFVVVDFTTAWSKKNASNMPIPIDQLIIVPLITDVTENRLISSMSDTMQRNCSKCESALENNSYDEEALAVVFSSTETPGAELGLIIPAWDSGAFEHTQPTRTEHGENNTKANYAMENNLPELALYFQQQMQKRIDKLEKLIKENNHLLETKRQNNQQMIDAFVTQIRCKSTPSSIARYVASNSSAAQSKPTDCEHSESRQANAHIGSSKALAKIVTSEEFGKYLDKQIVSSILSQARFKQLYPQLISDQDIGIIMDEHEDLILEGIMKKMDVANQNVDDRYEKVRRLLHNTADSGDFIPEHGKTDEEYKLLFSRIIECCNKGNLECDQRFLKIIGRTINKIGVYDDPVLCKMTVQFVLCKRYVEDFVRIKETLKDFSHCDL